MLSPSVHNFLGNLGYTGTTNDRLHKYLRDSTGRNGTVDDLLYYYLGTQNFTGSLSDRVAAVNAAGLVLPAKSFDFTAGTLPPGLTYTNSSTTRTYFGSDGLLKTAVANEPIFETLGGVYQGMRWEMEQRTNRLVQSIFPGSGVAPTSWAGGIAGASGPAASIYGNADGAQAWTQTATGNRPYLSLVASTPSPNTTYTLSVLIESATSGIEAQQALGYASAPSGATITYPACTANPAGGGVGNITVGVLEMRVAIAATTGTIECRVGLGCSSNATGTIQFSRPQFETGTSRSSFIPTAGSAVIRQPDVLAASSISPWFNATEGTIVFEGIVSDLSVDRAWFAFSDGSNLNRIFTSIRSSGESRFFGTSASTTQFDIIIGSVSTNNIFRHAVVYRPDDFASSINASAFGTDTVGAPPVGVNSLKLGVAVFQSPFMGYARRFSYYNRRLTNSEIQGLSRV